MKNQNVTMPLFEDSSSGGNRRSGKGPGHLSSKLTASGIRSVILLFALLVCGITSGQAQITTATPWVWMHGEKSGNQFGVYGTQGTPSSANTPGSITQGIGWATPDGNLWLLGGYGNASSASGRLNTLWKYTPSSDTWTWVKGDDNTNLTGVYGTKGVPATANKPGARSTAATWTDTAGNLWLFGGFGYTASSGYNQHLNDLWRFNPATNQWTWMKGDSMGDNSGRYGTKGVAAATNWPGSRSGSAFWQDKDGNFWLFGGSGFDANGNDGYLNDLWKYNLATGEWTWISGDNTINMTGVYGTMGTPAAANKPGGRQMASAWVDTAGNFWIFAGEYQSYYLNDLWRYNPATGQWTWMKGSNTTGASGVYGTKGTAAAANTPGARYGAAAWTGPKGKFWLLGGSYRGRDFFNDFWVYDPATSQWTWMKGDNVTNSFGIYGIKGQEDPANMPGARNLAVYWTDNKGMFWVFGGDGLGESGRASTLNDLWKFDNCVSVQQADSIIGDREVCANSSQTYSVPAVSDAASYTWSFPTGWTGSSNTNSITVTSGTTSGTISVVVNGRCDTAPAKVINVDVYPVPDAHINVSGFTLSTTVTYVDYQWFLNGNIIPGATDSNYTVTQNGDYTVAVVDENGCKDTSDIYKVTNANGIEDITGLAKEINIYPNPSSDRIYIQSPVRVNVTLTSITGRAIREVKNAHSVSVKDLAAGMYLLRISSSDGALIKVVKVVRQSDN